MRYLFDGGMGTMLQQAGMPPGYCPELWNIENPAAVTAIHRQYVNNGADIIETNTFGANRIKLSHYNLQKQVEQINRAAVAAARNACSPATKIAGSVGPTGKFIEPLGDLQFDEAYAVFQQQITALHHAGVDMIIIETMIDIQEMRAALLAAKSATDKPVICQMTFGADGRTITGTDPRTAALLLEAMGANVIGANCSLGPAQLLPVIETLVSSTSLPVSAQPNAGMPELIHGHTVFPMRPEEFGSWAAKLAAAGATYIGGCCGTTPEHIQAARHSLSNAAPPPPKQPTAYTALTSRSKTIFLGPGFPIAIIGERINPSGRKMLSADIRSGTFTLVKKEAISQLQAGAHILDVNLGVPGIDQAAAMRQVVQELSVLVEAPLVIDTADPDVLEAGLRYYPGRALINSISAEPERLAGFLPLAKKYGAAILCLPLTSGGVPKSAQERIAIVRTIIDAALAAGLRTQDLLLDALVLPLAADASSAQQVLEALRLYRREFGYPTVMGMSNISFGLPQRPLLNASFYAMAVSAGLDAPIANPDDLTVNHQAAAVAALAGHDPSGRDFSMLFAAKAPAEIISRQVEENILSQIKRTVILGEKEIIIPLIQQALSNGHTPLEITDDGLTAGMSVIGEDFGSGRCYLPQVMLAAETMRVAFQTIRQALPAHSVRSAGTVMLATVKGDIHDLGKNIVAALLENNGFTVIDLGKDISPEAIVRAAAEHHPDIIGLCALMTTTLPQIDITIKALHQAEATAHIMVGGAVLTPEYAEQAGAHSYAADAIVAVNLAKDCLRNTKNTSR